MARKSKGRQKIEMTKMTKESNLMATFSKRRVGLFKKASELSTLCGVQIAVIVFSPGFAKNVFSFGHPNVEGIIDKFLSSQNSNPENDYGMLQPVGPRIQELNWILTESLNQLGSLKTYREVIANERKQREALDWTEAPVEDLGLEQLQSLKSGLIELTTSVANQITNLTMMQQVQTFASTSSSGGGATDDPVLAYGIKLTPQGYVLF